MHTVYGASAARGIPKHADKKLGACWTDLETLEWKAFPYAAPYFFR